jgi:hypothetical protein
VPTAELGQAVRIEGHALRISQASGMTPCPFVGES